MIYLCKVTIFMTVIFVVLNTVMQIVNAIANKDSTFKLLMGFIHIIFSIVYAYLLIKCTYWVIFDYWRWGI